MDKTSIQSEQYRFPYHYIPNVRDGICSRDRFLEWGWEYAAYQEHLASKMAKMAPKRLLDVGCGDGYLINLLGAVLTGCELLGVDLDQRAISFARAFGNPGHFECVELSSVVGTFDVVSSVEVLEHVPDEVVRDFLDLLLGKVSSSGHLLITVPADVTPVIPKHYRHYSRLLLESDFLSSVARTGRRVKSIEIYSIFPKVMTYEILRKLLLNRWWRFSFDSADRLMWRWTRSLVTRPSIVGRHWVLLAQFDD